MNQPLILPKLYPILDVQTLDSRDIPLIEVAEAWLEAGVWMMQYRNKLDFTQSHFDEAKTIAALCKDAGCRFVMNDRADFARLLDADLHLGQDDLPPTAARSVVGSAAVIGFSTHNANQLRAANEEPADYLAIGPIFATTSKANPDPVVGIERLPELRRLTNKPLVAIGGITFQNATDALRAGADSVAVISGLLPASSDRLSLRKHVEEWLHHLGQ